MKRATVASPTLAALGDKVQGPFDFAWLLERAADFGAEAPPWHSGGALPSDFRSDPPPPPLQLMVPEMLSFEPTELDASGKGQKSSDVGLRALYFTDRAGYLRGTRRGARQGGVLFEAVLRLMRHRQPTLQLTHSSNTIAFERRTLENSVKAWTDRPMTYTHIPAELDRASFFAGPHTSVPTGEMILSSPQDGYAYVWCEDKPDSDGGIPDIGWDPVSATMMFGGGRTMRIFRIGGVGFQQLRDEHEGNDDSPTSLRSSRNSRRASANLPTNTPSSAAALATAQGASGPNAMAAHATSAGHAGAVIAGAGSTMGRWQKRSVMRVRSGTMTEHGSPRAMVGAPGSWRVCLQNGAKQSFSYDEIAAFSGATSTGKSKPWPAGARWLQACFWDGQKGINPDMVYKYDALRQDHKGTSEGVSQNIVNHFERYAFLDNVSDSNLVSAAPVLLSQHLSYHCGLELLSGDFQFMRDTFGHLWLVDARNLHFIAAARNDSSGGGGESAAGNDQDVNKNTLPRYLSEEALRNLPVLDDTGNKCQRMTELMHDHYKTMKVISGMADMLRQTDELIEISIPVFEGTDRRAFARTFGAPLRAPGPGGAHASVGAVAGSMRQPLAPKPQGIVGKGKLRALEVPRPASTTPASASGPLRSVAAARPSAAAAAAARGVISAWEPLLETSGAALARAAASASMRRPSSSGPRRPPSSGPRRKSEASMAPRLSATPRRNAAGPRGSSGCGSPGPRGTLAGGAATPRSRGTIRIWVGEDASAAGAGSEEATGKIEIVLADTAQKLLPYSGPGLRPDGPTLDICGPLSTRAPGVGLQARRQAARPIVRLVEVPLGAASAHLPVVAQANAGQRKSMC
mmetsp:Transcript_181100/g.574538  ORF Transcript_181100/g.574538 Transcript_181100/m.574538 type:complete len:857 (+) Transcript_181100:115-2685(+)